MSIVSSHQHAKVTVDACLQAVEERPHIFDHIPFTHHMFFVLTTGSAFIRIVNPKIQTQMHGTVMRLIHLIGADLFVSLAGQPE